VCNFLVFANIILNALQSLKESKGNLLVLEIKGKLNSVLEAV
jgi:hypothetical protein